MASFMCGVRPVGPFLACKVILTPLLCSTKPDRGILATLCASNCTGLFPGSIPAPAREAELGGRLGDIVETGETEAHRGFDSGAGTRGGIGGSFPVTETALVRPRGGCTCTYMFPASAGVGSDQWVQYGRALRCSPSAAFRGSPIRERHSF